MNHGNTAIYILVGLLVFVLVSGGIVIAIKKLSNSEGASGLKFFHEDTSVKLESGEAAK